MVVPFAKTGEVQNAIPLKGFESVSCTYQFIKYLLLNVDDLHIVILSFPNDAAVIPFPSPETTPPVTNTYFTAIFPPVCHMARPFSII